MSVFFISRPTVAIVIAILMVIMGAISLSGLPVAQYPDITPPTIAISAGYGGADAITVEQAVAVPIEQQMSGIENMSYMTSTNSNDGTMSLSIVFDLDSKSDTDQILTQMRESEADAELPQEVRNAGVTVQRTASLPLIMYALYSDEPAYDALFLSNYAQININDQMIRVPGVSKVNVLGQGKYAMRIWVKPDVLAKLHITIPDISKAIRSQNSVNPAGKIGAEPAPEGQQLTYTVRARGRLENEDDFGNIVIKANSDGNIVRLRDVSRIEMGSDSYAMISRFNGKPTALVALYQTPGSNALETANGIKSQMDELSSHFPPGVKYKLALDTTRPVEAGIHEIVETLFEALILVIVVVYVFLQGWRSTLIPLLAVPVSLLATFCVFPFLGFSVNTLSLFGLVLAIGLVVDDPIVVVESVEKNLEKGLSTVEATLETMKEVKGPIIATSLVLFAVFVPTALIPGITGKLYQQFSITVCVSVALSAFNSLTLSPALSALILKRKPSSPAQLNPILSRFNHILAVATDQYVLGCSYLMGNLKVAFLLFLFILGVAGYLLKVLPSSFLPEEDQSYIMAGIQLPTGSSLQRTDLVSKQVENMIIDQSGVEGVSSIVGMNLLSGVNNSYGAFFFIGLKDWSQRTSLNQKANEIISIINTRLSNIPEAVGVAFSPPAIPGVGNSGGISMVVEDRGGHDLAYLSKNVKQYVANLTKRPELAGVSTTLLDSTPQIFVDVDRDKAMKQGVDLSDIYNTLQSFMGSATVNYFNRFGRQWQVYLEAEAEYRSSVHGLGQFYVKNNDGQMVPLDTLTTVSEVQGPEFTNRYNLFRSATINAAAAPGFSSSQAMAAMEEVFKMNMPSDMGFDYTGMSYQENKASQGISLGMLFCFSMLCVYLILAAQYESWSLPFSVVIGTPIAVFGALIGLFFGGFTLNVYAQIGLVMLVGLSAKNAILIVEFANVKLKSGMDAYHASLEAAKLRFRPILMTAFAFIFGVFPLVTADGAGALSRQVMGYTILGGMLSATLIAIFFVPLAFFITKRLSAK